MQGAYPYGGCGNAIGEQVLAVNANTCERVCKHTITLFVVSDVRINDARLFGDFSLPTQSLQSASSEASQLIQHQTHILTEPLVQIDPNSLSQYEQQIQSHRVSTHRQTLNSVVHRAWFFT